MITKMDAYRHAIDRDPRSKLGLGRAIAVACVAVLAVGCARSSGDELDVRADDGERLVPSTEAATEPVTVPVDFEEHPLDESGKHAGTVLLPPGYEQIGSSEGEVGLPTDLDLMRRANEALHGIEVASSAKDDAEAARSAAQALGEQMQATLRYVPEYHISFDSRTRMATPPTQIGGRGPESITITLTFGDLYAPEAVDIYADFDPDGTAVEVRGGKPAVLSHDEDWTGLGWLERPGLSVSVAARTDDPDLLWRVVEGIEL